MSDVIVPALDGLTKERSIRFAAEIGQDCYALKIHDLVDKLGPYAIDVLKHNGAKKVWVDYKLHDIPKTVYNRAKALFDNHADIITVHASGGIKMMQAAVESGIEVFAVTVLTSLENYEVNEIYGKNASYKVMDLAFMAKEAGCHGIVCSPLELTALKSCETLSGMKFVTPGVRSPGVDSHDQKRVDTPASAIKNGATQLVVGRELTEASSLRDAFNSLMKGIS